MSSYYRPTFDEHIDAAESCDSHQGGLDQAHTKGPNRDFKCALVLFHCELVTKESFTEV